METVLVVGATGNIGIAAVKGALEAGLHVLAVVRNTASANKLYQVLGTRDGITTVEADILSSNGVQSVVDQVKDGKLPPFQHVYAAAGGAYELTALRYIKAEEIRHTMSVNFESNLFAYTATVPYLLDQNNPTSSWTLCTGSQGEEGLRAGPAMSQGPLYSMAVAACHELQGTNIRFNEVFLARRVEVDQSAERSGAMKSSDFAKNYETLLGKPDVKGSRVFVATSEDLVNLRYISKLGSQR